MCLQEFQKPKATATTTSWVTHKLADIDLIVNCVICSNLMQEPTTMQCGHSFCRACTIKWCIVYKHYNCPTCRQKLDRVLPKVNITLQTLIEYLKQQTAGSKISWPYDADNANQAVVELKQSTSFSASKPVAVNHSDLIRRISANFSSNTERKNTTKNQGGSISPSDSTLSRLNLLSAPVYLFLAFWGFLAICLLNKIKRVLK
jgi:hypothetical protein